jgi:hypothetical protein
MNRCARLFLHKASRRYFVFVSVLLVATAFEAGAQDRTEKEIFQKASFKSAEKICTVEHDGVVTALVKNGVELSTSEDWDCDGVPDAYDNCVGIANASQTDANSNGIGDACESAATIRSGQPLALKKKPESKRPRSEVNRDKKPEPRNKRSENRSKKSEDDRKKKRTGPRNRKSAETRDKTKSAIKRRDGRS